MNLSAVPAESSLTLANIESVMNTLSLPDALLVWQNMLDERSPLPYGSPRWMEVDAMLNQFVVPMTQTMQQAQFEYSKAHGTPLPDIPPSAYSPYPVAKALMDALNVPAVLSTQTAEQQDAARAAQAQANAQLQAQEQARQAAEVAAQAAAYAAQEAAAKQAAAQAAAQHAQDAQAHAAVAATSTHPPTISAAAQAAINAANRAAGIAGSSHVLGHAKRYNKAF